ncbi:MAG: hypothetical protein AAGB02_03125 [Pseudomonadota bacterium]
MAVVAPAAVGETLISVEGLRNKLDTEAQQSVLLEWISLAHGVIADLLNIPHISRDPTPLALQTYRETFNRKSPSALLRLARRPLVGLVAVSCGGEPVDLTLISINEDDGLLYPTNGVCWPAETYEVEYRAGYVLSGDARNVPAAIELAAVMVIDQLISARSADCIAPVKSESVPGLGAITYNTAPEVFSDGVPIAVLRLLSRYAFPYPTG